MIAVLAQASATAVRAGSRSLTGPVACAVAVLAVFGAGAIVAMTRWGVGTSPDAVGYIKAARYLAGEDGLRILLGQGPVEFPLTIVPPLYSFVLATGGLVGVDPFEWARWLGAALFACNIALVAWVVGGVTRSAAWLPAFGALLMLTSMPLLSVHVSALSEPLFILLTLAGLVLLARYLERPRRALFVTSALLIGLAVLNRYAGAACVLAACASLVLWRRGGIVCRLRAAAAYGTIAALPVLVWVARNMAVATAATGRELGFHPVGRAHAWEAFYTASGWLLVPASAPDRVRFAVWLALGLGAAALLVLARRDAAPAQSCTVPVPAVVRVLTLFVLVYGAFLAVSISLFDANTPLDDRILSPVYAVAVVVLLHALDRVWPSARARLPVRGVLVAALVGFSAVSVVRAAQLAAASHDRGWGFSTVAWQQSALLAHVRALPPETLVFSNAPDIVYLHTGRDAQGLPKRWLPMDRRANPRYPEELARLRLRLTGEPSVLVYFSGVAQMASVPSLDELRAGFPMRTAVEQPEGWILCAAGCPE